MKVSEARAIAREYDEAHRAMTEAIDRFERAHRAYQTLPLSFEPDTDTVSAFSDQTMKGGTMNYQAPAVERSESVTGLLGHQKGSYCPPKGH